jgi:predicted  nucleic acid-binding Zn-ribbon protein
MENCIDCLNNDEIEIPLLRDRITYLENQVKELQERIRILIKDFTDEEKALLEYAKVMNKKRVKGRGV